MNKIVFYLKLAWLCLKLSFNLFLFGLSILQLKFNQKKFWFSISIVLFLLIWSSNFYIFHKKNTPQIQIVEIQILENESGSSLPKERVLLTKSQAEEKIKNYEKTEQLKVHNLGLWLNLSQLNQVLGNEKLAQDYLNKAKIIAPHFKYLED